MQTEGWLNQDHQFRSGQELFRSERSFAVWVYTISHGQLLLRTRTAGGGSRIDVLFKPVEAMKVRADYDGLIVRCATAEEHDQVLAATGHAGKPYRVLMLETANGLDYVVTGAVGWREDHAQDHHPSTLAAIPPAADPARILPGADATVPG